MMNTTSRRFTAGGVTWELVVGLLVVVAILAAFCLAPTEQTMGPAQRIVYIHVPVAWLGLLGMLVMAGGGLAYLLGRRVEWDHWSQAAGEVGWLCSSLTLITGSLWAHEAWGTWWEWDPRLTTSFILWVIYAGILLTRGSLPDRHQRARVSAVLAILGALDIPLVVMATRWFRGLHPVSPEMEPAMRMALLTSVVGWTVFFAWLTSRRRAQVGLEQRAADVRRTMDAMVQA